MAPFNVGQKYRHIKRYRQIVTVLVKYGFSDLVDRLKLASYLQRGAKLLKAKKTIQAASTAERLRYALEELGPTFIKFGQVLSTRSFLIPADWIAELSLLQDKVKPEPFENLHNIIEKDLEVPITERFKEFDQNPLASASVAQVHRAITKNNDEVVVKIRRPHINRLVETDMEILRDIAKLIEKYLPESRRFNPVSLVDELARTTKRELDFMNEARNIELFARNFEHYEGVHVPKVFWDLTTSRMLTLEFIHGTKISEIQKLHTAEINTVDLAHRGAKFILKQIFEDGFFHGDPHPGNLLIRDDGVIVPVDFGIMGRLDDDTLEQFSDVLIAVSKRDIALLIRVMTDLGILEDNADVRLLRSELSEFVDRYYGVSLRKISMKSILNEVLDVMNRHQLRVPSNMMLLGKTLGAYEDLAEKLDPEFDFSEEVKPYVLKLIRRRLDVEKLMYQGVKTLRDLYKLITMLPRDLELLLRRLKSGTMSMEFQHRGLDSLIHEMDRATNRLSLSLLIAALIVGSSLIIKLELGPLVFGCSLIGILGYAFAGALGIWLIIAMLRSGRL